MLDQLHGWRMSAVFGAPTVSRALTTNDADSALLLRKYWEKPPLLTSDSTSQIAENTFCGRLVNGCETCACCVGCSQTFTTRRPLGLNPPYRRRHWPDGRPVNAKARN